MPSLHNFPSSMYYLTWDWPIVSHLLSPLHTIILPLTKPSPTLLLPKPLQQAFAETVPLSLPSLSQTYTHSSPLHLYASNASMIHHNPHNCPSVTFAVIAHQKAFTGSLSQFGHSANILHGEVYGLVVASLLMQKMLQNTTINHSPPFLPLPPIHPPCLPASSLLPSPSLPLPPLFPSPFPPLPLPPILLSSSSLPPLPHSLHWPPELC